MSDGNPSDSSTLTSARRGRNQVWLMTLVLIFLVLATFVSVLNCEFVDLDTSAQLVNNPTVHGLSWEHVKKILRGESPTTSYYPVRSLSFALDYEIWGGLQSHGFKLTNVLIHLSNVLLLFWLILRFSDSPARDTLPAEESSDSDGATEALPTSDSASVWRVAIAGFASGLFAVHPLVVEPVAWIPGREELLMTLWALMGFHCYMTARKRLANELVGIATWAWYGATALCCLLACLSNVVAAVLPLLVTVWDALVYRSEPRRWRHILYGTAILWLIALGAIAVKRSGVQTDQLLRDLDVQQARRIADVAKELGYGDGFAVGEVPGFSTGRLALMFEVFQLNLRSIGWPSHLSASYRTLPARSLTSHEAVLGMVAVVALLFVLWLFRRRRLVQFGVLWFLIALVPSSQLIHHHIHRADRFLYLPLMGLVVAVAFILQPLRNHVRSRNGMLILGVAGVTLLLILNIASRRQIMTWENAIAMWENCLRVDPENYLAHHMLATLYVEEGQPELAKVHFEETLKKNVYNVQALDSFAQYLAGCEDLSQRDYELAIRLATWAGELTNWKNPDVKHTLALCHNNYAVELGQRGDYAKAIEQYELAIASDNQYAAPLFNLALLRTACEVTTLRAADQGVELAERGLQLVADPTANQLMILAIAYAETGRRVEAAATTERAIAAARAAGNESLATMLQQRLQLFRSESTSAEN